MCGGVAHSFCMAVKWLSASKKHRQDCLMSSAQLFYSLCLRSVVHSLACCFSGNVLLFHKSRYILCDSLTMTVIATRPSHTLVLQVKNARMRRLGYDGTKTFLLVAESKILRTTVNTVPANSTLSSVNNRARYPV